MEKTVTEDLLHVDPRFATFYERLDSLRRPGESDREFAERIGIKLDTFRKWKYGVHVPKLWVAFVRLSVALSVGAGWLAFGWDSPDMWPLTCNDPRGFLVFGT